MKTSKIERRQQFLNVYREFDIWLKDLHFRRGHYWKESATHLDINYSIFEVDDLYGVEHYLNDALSISIRFLRDRHTHEFYIVNGFMVLSDKLTLDEMRNVILEVVRQRKEKMLYSLNKIIC